MAIESLCKNHGGTNLFALHIWRAPGFVFIGARGQKNNVGVALILASELVEDWFHVTTWATPGRPEIQHDNFSFCVGKLNRRELLLKLLGAFLGHYAAQLKLEWCLRIFIANGFGGVGG